MQFYCPQGHRLECAESQRGQRSRCPNCGVEFIVPQETQAAGVAEEELPVIRRPGVVFAEVTADAASVGRGAAPTSEQPPPERLLHIPCPSGHELETPESMIGRDAMCPFCRAEFRLQFKDSREFQAQQEQERSRRDQRIARAWMTWSLVAAALVVVGIALMVAVAMSN